MFEQAIKEKVVLVTGGTGSFGSTVVRSLLGMEPKKIIIFSRDEKKQFDMRAVCPDPRLEFRIGDVRDIDSVRQAIFGVNLVFHAAAFKQVPTGEFFPLELVKTNIVGSANVMQAAIDACAERLVILSTDKAVYPINAMGMTKALMEKIMISHSRAARNGTVLCGVRYGNVMYSRGSVIPSFVEQIKQGRRLTVTNPEMTRFMLPLSQSVDLVLYALAKGMQGDIFVRKASACTISVLVQALCRLFDKESDIHEAGIRAGEKMHETLVSSEELVRAEDMGDYYRITPESAGFNYEKYFTEGTKQLKQSGGYTSENTKRLSVEETMALLATLPEIRTEMEGSAARAVPSASIKEVASAACN